MLPTRTLLAGLAIASLPATALADAPRPADAPSQTLELPVGAVGVPDAEHPRGIYIVTPESAPPTATADVGTIAKAKTIIYMNRHGGTYTPGNNDSSLNRTTILRNGTAQIPEWEVSDANWRQVVDCVADQFSRFNVEVTDQDPGNALHIESVVAGYPEQLGMPPGVGGVSPFTCGTISSSIVFTFAEVYGSDYQEVCHTAAQEIAHSFGLDHELLCEDPMTYLAGCGPKTFKDQDAPCGEFDARECTCNSVGTQNSVQMLFDRLGPADPIAPTLVVNQPADGDEVDPGFMVSVTAEDDRQIEQVDLYIDGERAGIAPTPPYDFLTAADLPSGLHIVEVQVTDGANVVSEILQVLVRGADFPDSCNNEAPCPTGFRCSDGECEAKGGLFPPRDLGAYCTENSHCDSNLCLSDGSESHCSQLCDPEGEDTCAPDVECIAASGDNHVCWPKPGGRSSGDGGGCSVGGASAGAGWLLLLGLLAFRRRRS